MISIFLVMSAIVMTINFSNFYAIENRTRRNLNDTLVLTKEQIEGRYLIDPDSEPEPRPEADLPKNLMDENFIIVTFNEAEEVVNDETNTIRFIRSLSHIQCLELAREYLHRSENYAKVGGYRYKKAQFDEKTRVAIIDVSERRNEAYISMWGSFMIAGIGYLLFLLLILLMSRRVLKVNEKAYHNQKEFITNASHELKTPLTIISTDVEIIEMDHGTSEWTKSIKDQVQNLTTMTNQLVTSARLEEENSAGYPMEDFNVTDVIQESIDAFAASLKSKHLTLQTKLEENVILNGNKYLINELVYIFFDNVLKYCEEYGEVVVTLKKNKNKIEIAFANTLPKGNKVEVDKLFDRFYRDPENKVSGTGIGLSISKQIVELHKGKIEAVQEGGKIKFIVTL